MRNNPLILMYHSVGNESEVEAERELYRVSLDNFKKQIDCIAKTSGITLTFDDGDITNYKYALPILQERGLKAYFFIIPGYVGKADYMNWEQIRALKSAGMVIGSHGMSHVFITGLKRAQLDYEIFESKKILEGQLGSKIEYFSIPRGFDNKYIIKRIKEAGYKAVFTSNINDHDGFKFGRLPVKRDWDISYFSRIIKTGFTRRERFIESLRGFLMRALGARNYGFLLNITGALKRSKFK